MSKVDGFKRSETNLMSESLGLIFSGQFEKS